MERMWEREKHGRVWERNWRKWSWVFEEARQVFDVVQSGHCLDQEIWHCLQLHGVTSKNAFGFCKRKREKVFLHNPKKNKKKKRQSKCVSMISLSFSYLSAMPIRVSFYLFLPTFFSVPSYASIFIFFQRKTYFYQFFFPSFMCVIDLF